MMKIKDDIHRFLLPWNKIFFTNTGIKRKFLLIKNLLHSVNFKGCLPCGTKMLKY